MPGHYEKRGDVEEWVWDDPPEDKPKKNTTASASAVVKPKAVRKPRKAKAK